MIAAVLSRPGNIELLTVKEPVIGPDEVKIKIEGCGICASSIPLWEGRDWFSYPCEPGAPGHESWGVVKAIGGSITDVKPGDRVAFVSSNGYAEYDKANRNALVKLPKLLDGQPFPGEPLGCAMNIFHRSDISRGDTVAIIGTGFLGLLLCQLAVNAGAKVIAISRRMFSLQQAKLNGAAETIPLTTTWETTQSVEELTNQQLCSRVIEATGKQEGVDIATQIVAVGGRMVIAGYHQDGLRQVDLQKWNWKGIDVINAHERDISKYVQGIEMAVDAVTNGTIRPASLYTMLPISDINKGFEMTVQRPDGFTKALIQL